MFKNIKISCDNSITTNPQSLQTFDIRNFLDKLTPAKGKNRFICPVCGGNNLTIAPDSGKYQCWNGCECRDIRETLSPWAEVTGNNTQSTNKRITQAPKPKAPRPAPIPDIRELAKLPTPVTHPEKRKRGNNTEIEYPYSNTQWVRRIEKPNPEKPKGYEKITLPYHLNEAGKEKCSKGEVDWLPYRIDEIKAHSAGKWVLGVEGESCVEAARYLGLVAFTLQGASWNESELAKAIAQLKEAGVVGVTYFPDHDETGYKKATAMAEAAAKAQFPFLTLNPLDIWADMSDKGDILDWVKWGMTNNWNKEEFIKRLENAFNMAAAERCEEDSRIREALEIVKPISGFKEDIPDLFNPKVEFTQFVLESLYGDKPWISDGNKLYYWTDTYYKHSPDIVEISRIANFCNNYPVPTKNGNGKLAYPYAKPSKVKEVLEWAKMCLAVDSNLFNPPGLNCTNGVLQLDWNTIEVDPVPHWRLIDHDPNLYYIYEPLVKYDPEANSEACDRLLEVLDAPQRDIFLKTIASSLDLATVRQYKGRLARGLLLKGHGSNGKDTLREAVSMMYGRIGMTGCTLSDFAAYDEGRKFPLARLKNSRVNWASENANTTRLDKIQSLKAFITGDTLSAESKGRDENEFTPTGIALFNVNDTPKLQGTMEAISSRYGVIVFNKTFKIGADPSKGELEADPRFKYDPNFLQTEVLPAFLNRVLESLERLMSEGIDYFCTQKALEDIQVENSHVFQFARDTGLGYVTNGVLTAGDIWKQLQQWYQDNATLTYEESANGKQKAIWAEQANPSDRNVKGANQVLGRFQQLFPKCKRVTIPHPNEGKKQVQALQGIGFISGVLQPNDKCDNKLQSHTPIPTLVCAELTPIPFQDLSQKTTENQGFYPTNLSFLTPDEKIENSLINSDNADQESEKNSDIAEDLGLVECDLAKSSTPEMGDWNGTGVDDSQTKMDKFPLVQEEESPIPNPQQEPDFSTFPFEGKETTYTDDIKRSLAEEIKAKFEACQSEEDFVALRDSEKYSKEQKNWVRKNLISEAEQNRFKKIVAKA